MKEERLVQNPKIILIPFPNDSKYEYRYLDNDCLGNKLSIFKGFKYNKQNDKKEFEVAIKVILNFHVNKQEPEENKRETEMDIQKQIYHSRDIEYDFIQLKNNIAYLITKLCDEKVNKIKLKELKEILQIIRKDKNVLNDSNFLASFRVQTIKTRFEKEFDNLSFLLNVILKLCELLKNSKLKNELFIDVQKLIFYYSKFHFSLTKHLHDNLERNSLKIWFSDSFWELFYKGSLQKETQQKIYFSKIFQNSKKIQEILGRKCQNEDLSIILKKDGDNALKLLINIENCTIHLLKLSSDIFNEYDSSNNKEISEIYESFYCLMICLSWKQTLDEGSHSINQNLFLLKIKKEKNRRLLFTRIKKFIEFL